MSQAYDEPTSSDSISTAIATKIVGSLAALRTNFSGATAPTAYAAYQLWMESDTALLKMRNAGNSAWSTLAKLDQDWCKSQTITAWGAITGTTTKAVFCAEVAGEVNRLVIITPTATSSSSGNEWTFTLTNHTTGNNLFSATVGTDTSLTDVGGGSELAAYTVYPLVPDQNAAFAADAVLKLTITEVGSATSLADLHVQLDTTYSV